MSDELWSWTASELGAAIASVDCAAYLSNGHPSQREAPVRADR